MHLLLQEGRTALMIAAEGNHLAVVQALLDANARFDLQDKVGVDVNKIGRLLNCYWMCSYYSTDKLCSV